jgi:hypothetical protein
MREVAVSVEKELALSAVPAGGMAEFETSSKTYRQYNYVTFTIPELNRQRESARKRKGQLGLKAC